jgi:glutaredoxin
MHPSPSQATLTFYRRRACEACEEARHALQQVLEDRARRGEPVPRVRYLDVDEDPALRASHGPRVPVLALAGNELSMTFGHRQIALFLERHLARLA